MPAQDRFLISDSEVDETAAYKGFNLFTATRTGSGFGSGTCAAHRQQGALGHRVQPG